MTYVEESPQTVTETRPVQGLQAGEQAGDLGTSRRPSAGRSPPAHGGAVFVLVRASTAWARPTTLCRLSCSTQCPPGEMIIFSKNCFTETSRITLDRVSGHRGTAKLIRKMTILYKWGTSRSNVREDISGLPPAPKLPAYKKRGMLS